MKIYNKNIFKKINISKYQIHKKHNKVSKVQEIWVLEKTRIEET